MSTLHLRHLRRHLLSRVSTMIGTAESGVLILLSGPSGSDRPGMLDALVGPLSHRPLTRVRLLPWDRERPGALRAPAEEGAVVLVDDLQHAGESDLRALVSRVHGSGAAGSGPGLSVVATVDGPGLDHLASEVVRLPPFTLAETASHLLSLTGDRIPVDTVEIIHAMSGGLPEWIAEITAAAPAGHLAVSGNGVPIPESWQRRWADTCARLSPDTVAALHRGELERSPAAVEQGVLHRVPGPRGMVPAFRDPRDAAVAASRNPAPPAVSPAPPPPGSAEFERRQLARARVLMSRLDLPGAELYLGECRGRVDPQEQDGLRGYLALYGGRRRKAHAYLGRGGSRPEEVARTMLLGLADWDPQGMRRTAAEVRGADPASAAVAEVEILGLLADAAVTGRRPSTPPGALNALNRQRLDLVEGWLALVFDDPLTAREKLQPLPGHSPVIGLWQDAWLARTLYVLGEWSRAARVVERGLAGAETHGVPLLEPLLLWTGVQISAMQGDARLSRHYLHRLNPGPDAFLIQTLPSAMGRMIVAATDADLPAALRAGRQLSRTVATADTQHPGFWPWEDVYAQTLIRAGKVDLADQVVSSAERRHGPSGLASLRAKNAVPRATIQFQRGETAEGLRTFAEAVELIGDTPMPAYQARILFEYGKVLRRHGRRSQADDVLSRAADVFTQMGATAMVQRCAAERRIGGVGSHQPGRHGLTPQEEQIAVLVAEGATNAEVARELTLSTKTVEYHLTRVYRKLGLSSRRQLRTLLGPG